MDSPIDFTKFKEKKDLESYCTAQYVTLQAAAAEIASLQEQVKHLETLLTASVQTVGDSSVVKIIKSPELAIVEAQINILARRAGEKELTLEEVKTLDLLVKNKRLLSEESSTLNGAKDKPKRELSEAQLISIARVVKKDG